jgi:hypothetical protein
MATVLGMGSHSNSNSPSNEANWFLTVQDGLVCAWADGRREARACSERILYKRFWMARR